MAQKKSASTKLMLSLDFPRADHAMEWVNSLQGLPVSYRVGLELFLNGGADLIRELTYRKFPVFLDLKLFDIPECVAKVAKHSALIHASYLSFHLMGGRAMVKAVLDAFEELPMLRPKLLGVGILSSFDDVRWAELTRLLTGHAVSLEDSSQAMVEGCFHFGLDGMVCSQMELVWVKKQYPHLFTAAYGLMLSENEKDQGGGQVPLGLARDLGLNLFILSHTQIGSFGADEKVRVLLNRLS